MDFRYKEIFSNSTSRSEKNLKSVIERLAEKSKRTWTYRGKRETDDLVVHVWNRYRTRNGGFMYEINRDYPLLVEIQKKNPEIASRLLLLMKQIEENLPLNSLYLDLTNDEKIENDKEVNSAEVIAMLHEILKTTESSLHSDMIDMLKKTEPFCNHIEEIDKVLKEGIL